MRYTLSALIITSRRSDYWTPVKHEWHPSPSHDMHDIVLRTIVLTRLNNRQLLISTIRKVIQLSHGQVGPLRSVFGGIACK